MSTQEELIIDDPSPDAALRAFTNKFIGEKDEPTVTFETFDPERVIFGVPVDKDLDASLEIPPYVFMPILYKYVLKDGSEVAKELAIRSPLMYAARGVGECFKKEDKKREKVISYSMGLALDRSNKEHVSYAAKLVKLYQLLVAHLVKQENRSNRAGVELSKFFKNGASDNLDIASMTNPDLAWIGCTFPINYKKQGEKVLLEGEQSLYSAVKRARDATGKGFLNKYITNFVVRDVVKDSRGIVITKNGRKVYKYTEIAPDVINVSCLTGYAIHRFPGVNITKVTAKIKHEVESMMVIKTGIKTGAIRDAFSDIELNDEEMSANLKDDIHKLLPELELYSNRNNKVIDVKPGSESPDTPSSTAHSPPNQDELKQEIAKLAQAEEQKRRDAQQAQQQSEMAAMRQQLAQQQQAMAQQAQQAQMTRQSFVPQQGFVPQQFSMVPQPASPFMTNSNMNPMETVGPFSNTVYSAFGTNPM